MTATAQATPNDQKNVRDAFIYLEDAGTTDYHNWIELLSSPKNRKGCGRITVEAFAGRRGFVQVAEYLCSTEDGHAPQPGDEADIDPMELAGQAYQVCLRDQKRNARENFRLQLWTRKKKDGPLCQGEYSTIKLGTSEGTDYDTKDIPGGVLKVLHEHNRDMRGWLKDIMKTQVEMAQAAGGTVLHGVALTDNALRMRGELQDAAVKLQTRATPADVNKRIETIMDGIKGPLATFANAAAGAAGVPPAGFAADDATGHKAAQAFFGDLSAEQKDKLRDALGQDKFGAVVEVIMGPEDQWVRERENLGPTLRPHFADLQRILTPEQFAKLLELAS